MRALRARIDRVSNTIADVVTDELEAATPVDTGAARASWRASHGKVTQGGEVTVTSDAEYMPYLNRGSSSQAPAGFVREAVRAALRKVGSL
jgi:HK97 gp10 family phage protein